MALVVDVPLNTMLADLDETLRVMLKRELGRHGFDGVEVAFDAPARDWSSQLSSPTVNLFLYDIRESRRLPPDGVAADRANGHHREVRPPMIMECSYAVTAWTQAVEDEHRLLSQVLGVLFAFPQLPEDALAGRLAETARRFAIEGKIGQPKADGKADFWSAVGGQYKASLDYVVTLACESGVAYERGPEVRTQTVLPRIVGRARLDDPRDAPLRRQGGRRARRAARRRLDHAPGARAVRRLGPAGPLPARPGAGRHARAGRAHRATAARPKAEIAVPGAVLDLRMAAPKARRRRRADDRMGSRRLPERLPPSLWRTRRPDRGCLRHESR